MIDTDLEKTTSYEYFTISNWEISGLCKRLSVPLIHEIDTRPDPPVG